MKMVKVWGVLGILCSAVSVFAQKAQVSVDNFTGALNVNIPLYTVKKGGVTVPISVAYRGGGIKMKDVAGEVGLGWNLIAGGGIYRQLRGLPDEAVTDGVTKASGNPRLGWLFNTNGTKINNFTISNDNNPATCTDDAANLTYINNNFGDLSDTEPDIFQVSAPGLSCKLVFDKDKQIRTIPYQDLKISYTLQDTSQITDWWKYSRIKSFTITNNEGTTFRFENLERTSYEAVTTADPATIKYFKHEFDQYRYGIDFVSAWKLTSITDINHNSIWFMYSESENVASDTKIGLSVGGGALTHPFTYRVWTRQQNLSSIIVMDDDGLGSFENGIKFVYLEDGYTNRVLLDTIKGLGQLINFRNGINMPGDTKITFDYYNTANGSPITFPDSTSKKMDWWGYYNGSTANSLLTKTYINPSNSAYERYRNVPPGAAASSFSYLLEGEPRTVNQDFIAHRSLKSIKYSHGGATNFVYESNDYYDPTAGTVVKGGGIRVKQIISSDSLTTGNNVVENYAYVNPSTGLSSGKPVTLPVLAFTTPYTGSGSLESQWQNSTVRLEENPTQEDNSIIYSHVTVSKSGAGRTLYEYSTPATEWDNSASPDWNPTIVNVARPNCISAGFVTAQKNTYPFIPNTNFDFERGLLNKVTVYNETNQKVKESVYTYQRTGSPVVIPAFKYDYNDGVVVFGKYSLLADVGKQILQVTTTDYDLPSLTSSKTAISDYEYGSSFHKLPTVVKTTNSDGSIVRDYSRYIKDYTAIASGDPLNNAIYKLQQENLNIPIETYTKVERSGINKTISGSLIKFGRFTFLDTYGADTLYLPTQKLQFSSSAGVTNFVASTITSGTFSHDSRYKVKENDLIYTRRGSLLSRDDNNHKVQTVIPDEYLNVPVAVFNDARADEIAFDNFDSQFMKVGFTNNTTNSLSTDKRSGKYSLVLNTSNLLTRSINKNTLTEYYIFSAWINTSSSGNLTLSLTNSSNATSTYSVAFTSNTTYNSWKYYEIKVPVNNMSSTFIAKVQTTSEVKIDDVLFYPAQADVNTIAYDLDTHLKMSETNTHGVSTYYDYDALYRLKHVYDQDKNIIAKRTYVAQGSNKNYSISLGQPITWYYNTILQFNDYKPDDVNDDASYTWNFGDGTALVNTKNLNGAVTHVYRQAGTYTYSLTKTSPYYGTVSATNTISITAGTPYTIDISADNNITNLYFYHDNTLLYTYNSAQIAAGNMHIIGDVNKIMVSVINDVYDNVSNPGGLKRVRYSGYGPAVSNNRCQSTIKKVTNYTFSNLDFSGMSSISFNADYEDCPPLEPEEIQ